MVFYDFLEIRSHAGPYENGHRWAEPSIPEAANAMRWVFNHPEEAQLLGERPLIKGPLFLSPGMRQQNARPSEPDSMRAKQKMNRWGNISDLRTRWRSRANLSSNPVIQNPTIA